MRIYILVNTEEEFADWCRYNHVNPVGVRCVLDGRELRGKLVSGDRVIDARVASPLICSPAQANKVAQAQLHG